MEMERIDSLIPPLQLNIDRRMFANMLILATPHMFSLFYFT